MKKTSTTVLLLFLLTLASCSLLPDGLTPGNSSENLSRTQELLIPVTRGSITSSLSFVGNLQYNQSSTMSWKTDGVIEKVYVKVGDRVKKDDVLAELAPDSLSSSVLLAEKSMIEQQEKLEDVLDSKSQRMQAYVTLNAKESALQKAKLEQEALYYPRATREEMERAWDKYALANLNFNYAKQDYDYLVSINESWEGFEEDRDIRMFGRSIHIGGDSRSGRERKFEDYVNTYNDLVSAYENYVWTTGRPTDTEYAVAEGNVAVAQMEYDKALEDYLSYENLPREKDVKAAQLSLNSAETVYKSRYILAPFDGVVTSVSAVESYYVKKGAEAFRVDDKSQIYVPLSISELDVTSLTNGTPVTITVDAVSGKTYSGHLYSIADASTVSGNTTAFSAMVVVDDPDDSLLSGMTAEVSFDANEKTGVLLIPNTAISYTNGTPCVTVVNGDERQIVEISLGTVSGGISEVTSGNLHEGDLLSVSSVSSETLTALGLDPSQYLTENPFTGAMPGAMPEMPFMAPERNGERTQRLTETVVEFTATETAAPEIQEPTETVEMKEEKPVETLTETPEAAEPSFPDFGDFPEMGDGSFPMPPGGGQFPNMDGQMPPGRPSRPEGSENGGFPGFPDGQHPPGGGDGQNMNRMPQSVPTAESNGSGEKG